MNGLNGKGDRQFGHRPRWLAADPDLETIRPDSHAESLPAPLAPDHPSYMPLTGTRPDHDPAVRGPKRTTVTEQMDCLEKRGLARAVASGEDVDDRIENELRRINAAKALHLEIRQQAGDRRCRANQPILTAQSLMGITTYLA